MKIFNTGVPSLYSNGTPNRTGLYPPNLTPRSANDQMNNQSINSYTAIEFWYSHNGFEQKAYTKANTDNGSINNSSVINGGGAA